MKIFRTVDANQLHEATRDGWTWDGQIHKQAHVFIVKDIDGRDPTPKEREALGLSQYIHHRIYEPTQRFFGEVMNFIVSKESEKIDREQAAEARAVDLSDKLHDAEARIQPLTEMVKKLSDERDQLQRNADHVRVQWNGQTDRNRKLEGDIAKIRAAIGDMKMNEILGSK